MPYGIPRLTISFHGGFQLILTDSGLWKVFYNAKIVSNNRNEVLRFDH